MHIGIFAERFVGRYGADRVNVILAELLEGLGHRVTLVGVRFSPPVLERFPRQTIRVPDYSGKRPEPRTLRYLKDTHYYRRRHLPEFDACVVGSYPFITSIPYLRELGPRVLFIDYGVVPTYGYPPQVAGLIEEVRGNRRQNLRHATHIVAISDFIAREQSVPDCQTQVPVSTVLLGADHLVGHLGYTEKDKEPPGNGPKQKSYTRSVLEQLREMDRKLVLVLGRWEPGCYKNSQAAFRVLRSLLDYEPDAALLVMAHPSHFAPPPASGLEGSVFCVGLPSDADLLEVARAADAGISVSLWEGFNLPIVELQYLEKQAFAFRLAAHPEVVVSEDQLCADEEDMAAKLCGALRAGARPAWAAPEALGPWREKFAWHRFLKDFSRILERAA